MRHDARVQATVEILVAVIQSKRGADWTIQSQLRHRRYMGSRDRRDIKERLYGILHNWGGLCQRLGFEPTSLDIPTRLIVALHLKLHEGVSPDNFYTGGPYAPAALTAVELECLDRAGQPAVLPNWAYLNVPSWMLKLLMSEFGAQVVSVLSALNRQAPLDLRVLSSIEREAFLRECRLKQIEAHEIDGTQFGVRFARNYPVGKLPGARNEHYILQDAGSQIVADVTARFARERGARYVWDVCAGGGGKTIALRDQLPNGVKIIASDIAPQRLREARKRLNSLKIAGVQTQLLDENWLRQDSTSALPYSDFALIDAPCSGSGAWRRAPFSRWRFSQQRFERILETQRVMLDRVAAHLSVGSMLVYLTCSILPQENQYQTQDFVKRHTNYRLVEHNLSCHFGSLSETYLVLRPDVSDTDGLFLAAFERVSA